MRMKDAQDAGMDPREAAYKNFGYFSNPADKNFAPDLRAVAPPPTFATPTIQNFPIPGTTNNVPGVVNPHTGSVQFVPRSALPQESEEVLPKVIELDDQAGGKIKIIANPKTGHFERFDKGKLTAILSPAELGRQLEARGRIVSGQLRNATGDLGDEDKKRLNGELEEIKTSLRELSTTGQVAPPPIRRPIVPPVAISDRVRVKSPDGKTGTISRSALEQARKAGYSVLDATD